MIYTKLNKNNNKKISKYHHNNHHQEESSSSSSSYYYYYWLSSLLRLWPITTIIIFNFIKISSVIYLSTIISTCFAQDYDVSEIQCSFASQQQLSGSISSSNNNNNVGDSIMAKLKKPLGFKGSPLFADDRLVNPEIDRLCSIKQDLMDPAEQSYDLKILDFSKCGVLKRNGFVHVRIWFPQFPGVVMQSDQELIIMCKPPEPTVIQNKAAGFAGSFPHGARVSGVVEESPGRLEYEVALYKEAPPVARITGIGSHHHLKNQSIAATTAAANQNELPVDQAVPIGTKLQLRARISTQSVWKYVKLMEVSVSPDPDDPHSIGAVSLIHDGCRNRDFASIIPHQPARYRDRPNEVFLDFEAFLLSSMKERSTLWIHSQIKACMDIADCQPDFCLDLFEPSGHGRKKRYLNNNNNEKESEEEQVDDDHSFIGNHTTSDYARFKENIEYTVILPGDYDENRSFYQDQDQCKNFILISGLLAVLLALSTIISCALVSKIQGNVKNLGDETFCSNKGYAGRAIVQ